MSATELLEPVLKGGIRSINFFNGRLLSAEDMTDEQNANRQGRALAGQAVGEGIAYGLEVAKSSASTVQDAVVTVAAGLAFNRRGQALRLPAQTDVALSRRTSAVAAASSAAAFKPCVELQGGVYLTDAGVYLLTVAPAEGREGRAPSSGLGNTSAPCAARYSVEGVQFRLVQLLKASELGAEATLRSRVAYQVFGAETLRQYEGAPFTQPPRRYGLLDALRPNTLTDAEAPLALVYWKKQTGVEFVDLWSVRRRPVRPSVTERWGALADDRRVAEAEAMMLQFQEQVAALQTGASLNGVRAEDRFAYLPPAGLLPVGGQGFNWQTFLGPHAPPEATNLDEGLLRSVLARSVFVGPVKINSFASALAAGQAPPAPVSVYRVPGNNDFVLFARSTRGRLRVFLGSANTNVPVRQIYAESARSNTRHYAAGGSGGIYTIDRLDAGAYDVTVNASGFPDEPTALVVTAGRTTDLPLTAGAPGSILVTVRDKATGASIANKVQAVTATGADGAAVPGSAAGDKWQVPNLPAGSYSVAVAATGYVSKTAPGVAVALGQVANLTVELDAVPTNDAVINLEVSDRATGGRIDASVQSVKATNTATGAAKQGAKGAGGAWAVTQLSAGTYNVEVTAANYQKETATNFQLAASQTKTLPVQMTPTPGSINLTALNAATGASIDDKVTAVSAVLGTTTLNGAKGTDGKWSIANVPPGTYSVTVTAADFQTKTEPNIAVAAAEAKPLTIGMQPVPAAPGSINLTVTDEQTGGNIDDKVTAASATSGSITFHGTKGTNGKWTISNLPPGTYNVEVTAANYNTKTVGGVPVVTGTVQGLGVALQPKPGTFTLTATDEQTGANIDNKVASFKASNGQQTFTGTKGTDGKWSVGSLQPGTYSLTVTATNYQAKTTSGVSLAPGQNKGHSAALQPTPGSINLTVNVSGTNLAIDARVSSVTAQIGQQTYHGTQGTDGKWTISNLPPGTYSVTVNAPRYNSKTATGVQVTAAAATPLTVALTPTMSKPPTSIEFTRGDLERQHTDYSISITDSFVSTPPSGTVNVPDEESVDWLVDWRTWYAVTRPDKGIDETKAPRIRGTGSFPVGDETVHFEGYAVFFRADNTRVAVPWDKFVTTVFPGTSPQ